MGTPFHVFVTLKPGESRFASTHTPQPLQVRQLDLGAALTLTLTLALTLTQAETR